MERPGLRPAVWQGLGVLVLLTLIVCFRQVLATLAYQLAAAYLLMALALPLCRLMEKRLSPSMAASLSFAALTLIVVGVLLLLVPPLIQQTQQLADALPALASSLEGLLSRAQAWLHERGIDLTSVREEALGQLKDNAGTLLSTVGSSLSRVAESAGKLFLAPLFAFYLLRDRRKIADGLMLIFPVRWRCRVVRAAREMRRETVGFLRGQLLVSAVVGVLSAVGLLLVGAQGWLLLGLLMGVLELIPYLGPLLAGIPAVLLALPSGMGKTLWTVAVLVAVQQIEGSFLSPRLLSGATKLHPLWVLLTISAGGMIGGTLGMLLALPLTVSLRGAVRGLRA